jgi:hypothetical protein
MSNRVYRLIVGIVLLLGLYLEIPMVIYCLIGVLLFEGITNLRIPILLDKLGFRYPHNLQEGTIGLQFKTRTNFEAERVWRLLLAVVLIIVYVLYYEIAWGFAWFMAIAIIGAGLSGVCPLFITLKWFGFR